MSPLKRALISGYVAQIYTALIGIVMAPVYLRYLGAEAFGLVGFFTMMQAWLQLLDLGLTPTLSREMARYKSGVLDLGKLGSLLRTMEWYFGSVGLAMAATGLVAAPWLARKWLQLNQLPLSEVAACIALMGAIAGLRWMMNVYRSGLVGLERQTLANGLSAATASVKFLGVLPMLAFVSNSPLTFFSFQAAVSILEVGFFRLSLYRNLKLHGLALAPSWSALREVLPFAGGVAFTGAVWIFVMNLDKLLLSHLLPLDLYGYFSIAVGVAGGITLLLAPVAQVMQPRITILHSQGRQAEQVEVFREVTQFVSCLMAALSVNIAIFAEPLLFAWTGDVEAAGRAAPILSWYALGNGLVGLLTLPYLLQHAAGKLDLHVIGNIVFSMVQIPCVTYAAYTWGGYGTAVVWFVSNFLFLLAWVPLVFKRFLPGLYLAWLTVDIAIPALAAAVPALLATELHLPSASRLLTAVELLAVGLASLLCACLAGKRMRMRLFGMLTHIVGA